MPALIVTGEPALERVVPPEDTLAYRAWLPGARAVTLAATGHNGCVTKAREFADEVAGLLAGLPSADAAVSSPSLSENVRAYRVS